MYQNQTSGREKTEQDNPALLGLLTEHELTRVFHMVVAIQSKLGIVDHENSELADFEMETKPEDVLAEIYRLRQKEYNTR